jgi:ATP-dependent RNA helicase DeaD
VLCPTRELTLQVANEIKKLTNEYKVVTVYGGASISNQIRDLERGAAIIVATPGRLIDLIEK